MLVRVLDHSDTSQHVLHSELRIRVSMKFGHDFESFDAFKIRENRVELGTVADILETLGEL